jgi:hypothetical protein
MMSEKRSDRAAARNEEETLPLGVLPHITDTDPPPVHPDTIAGPPSVIDVPYASQEGAMLSCTMGNWANQPETYAYQWQIDGKDVGDNAATYAVGQSDVGKTATCIVTATNDLGTSPAPPSNPVTVAPGAVRAAVAQHATQARWEPISKQ